MAILCLKKCCYFNAAGKKVSYSTWEEVRFHLISLNCSFAENRTRTALVA